MHLSWSLPSYICLVAYMCLRVLVSFCLAVFLSLSIHWHLFVFMLLISKIKLCPTLCISVASSVFSCAVPIRLNDQKAGFMVLTQSPCKRLGMFE